jgi:hypothetical protein
MKKQIFTALLLTATIVSNAQNMEQQHIIAVINDIFKGADARDWEMVQNAFAPEVLLDYSSFGAGDPARLTPAQISSAWQGLLPGFDRTEHRPDDFQVKIEGNSATVTCSGAADHFIGKEIWTVRGQYEFHLLKNDRRWQADRMTFRFQEQTGNTALPAQAQLTAKKIRHRAAVENFFVALETQNFDLLNQVFAENGRQLMPYSPEGFPKSFDGRAAIYKQYSSLPQHFGAMRFPRTIVATDDPDFFFVKFQGDIEVKAGGRYRNDYIGTFRLADGRITEYTEYFNPLVMAKAFGISLAENSPKGNIRKVEFQSEGLVLRGHLHLPKDFDAKKRYPAVVIAPTWLSVKEQMADLYASKLAEHGFVALTFDFRNFGESEGQPRQFESPKMKVQDLRNAVSFLENQDFVEKNSLAGLGICAGAGYIAHAAAQDARLKKIVVIAPWLHDAVIVEAIYGGREGGVAALVNQGREAATTFATTGQSPSVTACSATDPTAAMYLPGGGFDYYLNPAKGAIPEWTNNFALMSWPEWLQFDAIAAAPQIHQPFFLIHSENGAVPQGAHLFFEKVKSEKKEVWLNEFNQLQLYIEPEAVNKAAGLALQWLQDK